MDPAAELTALPDVPLQSIVSFLPLQQLIATFPLVHPRFTPIRASVLRSNQRLLLYIGLKGLESRKYKSPLNIPFAGQLVDRRGALLYGNTYPSDFYQLRLPTLDSHMVEQLSSLMPAVAHLEVVLNVDDDDSDVFSQITILLAFWAPTLRTFKCNGRFSPNETLGPFRLMVGVINKYLTALEHLTLDLGFDTLWISEDPRFPPLRLPVLSRLREFNFWADSDQKVQAFIWNALQTYASERLTSIGLYGHGSPYWTIHDLARNHLASRFTVVPFHHTSPAATLFCRDFPNLAVSTLDVSGLSSDQLAGRFRDLSTLRNLQYLRWRPFYDVTPGLVANLDLLPPLASLKVLLLDDWTPNRDPKEDQDHHRLEGSFWATLFPSVQIIKIRHDGVFCTICFPRESKESRANITDYAQVTPCLTQLFAPLKVLPSFRKIFYQWVRGCNLPKGAAEFTPEGTFVRTHEHIG